MNKGKDMVTQKAVAKKVSEKVGDWTCDQALDNDRHELFCQHYAGDCFGDIGKAYIKAGFATDKSGKNASSLAMRLLDMKPVCERLRYLRNERMKQLGIDQAMIMQRRLELLDNPEVSYDTKVKILKDMEAGLGLIGQKVDVTSNGNTIEGGGVAGVTVIQFVE